MNNTVDTAGTITVLLDEPGQHLQARNSFTNSDQSTAINTPIMQWQVNAPIDEQLAKPKKKVKKNFPRKPLSCDWCKKVGSGYSIYYSVQRSVSVGDNNILHNNSIIKSMVYSLDLSVYYL